MTEASGERVRKSKPHGMGLQVPRGLDTQVSQEIVVWPIAYPYGGNHTRTCPAKGEQSDGGASYAGPHPYAHLDSPKIRGCVSGWFYQRQKRNPYSPKFYGPTKEFRRPKLLGTRLLRFNRRSG